jgi:hypothetical protein
MPSSPSPRAGRKAQSDVTAASVLAALIDIQRERRGDDAATAGMEHDSNCE